MNWPDPTDPFRRSSPPIRPTHHARPDNPNIPAFFAALGSLSLLTIGLYLLAAIFRGAEALACFGLALAHMAAVLGGIWLFYRHKAFGLGLIVGGIITVPLLYIILLILVYLFSDATW
jgi:hypothetical protein